MNSVERVLCALRGKPADKIPKGEIIINPGFVAKMVTYHPSPLEMEREVLEELKADLVVVNTEYAAPQKAVRYWRNESDLFVFAMVHGPLWASIDESGLEELSRLVVSDFPTASRKIQEYSRRQLDIALSYVDAGAHGILIADDLAGKTRTLVSPKTLRQAFFPTLKMMLEKVNERGVPVAFHSDGNIRSVLKDLAALGFSAIHGLEPGAGMNLNRTRAVVGEQMALWGNLEFEGSEGLKSMAEIVTETNALLEQNSEYRYIFGSNTGLYDNVSPELARAAYGAVEEFRNWKAV